MDKFSWSYQKVRFTGTAWLPLHFELVVVIVHGHGEHTGRYRKVAEFLNKEGYAVIGLDQYGHGRSDGARGASKGMEFCFNYLAAFLEFLQLTYQKKLVLYGQCMGGSIVSGFVLKRQPVIEGVIISSPALLFPNMSVIKRTVVKVASMIVPDLRIKQRVKPDRLTHDSGVIVAFKKDVLNHSLMSIRLVWDMIRNGEWCIASAERLNTPALLIHGSEDAFTSVTGSRRFASVAPAGLITYREWPGAYHELHNEGEKGEVLALVSTWIGQLLML
jgi:acylglycerol lipase